MRIAILWMLVPLCALAQAPRVPYLQPPPPRQEYVPAPPTMNSRDRDAAEKQQAAYLEYQKCITEHRKEFELHAAASQVVELRKNRAATELELANSPGMRARWPGGYEQIVAASFENYRNAGGTAPNAEAVVELPHPCAAPASGKP